MKKLDLMPSSSESQQLQRGTVAVDQGSQPVQQLPYGQGGGRPFGQRSRLAGALWEGGV